MEEIFKTKDIDERNAKITELYKLGKEYSYSRKDKEGYYTIKFKN